MSKTLFTKANIINFILFQSVWFGCVLGGGVYQVLWPSLLALTLLVISLGHSSCIRQDVLLAICAMPLGWLMDTAWIQLGIIRFSELNVAPYWIVFLWIGVALTVNHSLSPFRDRPLIGALVVGVFAPVTYLAGERLGAVIMLDVKMLWVVSLTWALVFYGAFHIARRGLDRWGVA